MPLVDLIAKEPPLREVIARAIFDSDRGHKPGDWDKAKHHDQWLAVGAWDQSKSVLNALPLVVDGRR